VGKCKPLYFIIIVIYIYILFLFFLEPRNSLKMHLSAVYRTENYKNVKLEKKLGYQRKKNSM